MSAASVRVVIECKDEHGNSFTIDRTGHTPPGATKKQVIQTARITVDEAMISLGGCVHGPSPFDLNQPGAR